jgi:hypothetical protein
VIAQRGHEVGERPAVAGEGRSGLAGAAARDAGFDKVGVLFGEAGDGEAVGDGARAVDAFGRPDAAGGFEDEGARGVGDDEAVVIEEAAVLVAAAAALAVGFEQLVMTSTARSAVSARSSARRIRSMPSRPVFRVGLLREDGLVADDDAVFVRAHLAAPHPEGAAEQDRVGFADLGDGDPGALDRGAVGMDGAGMPVEVLGLVGIAVGVLGEQDAAGFDDGEGIAHGGGSSGRRRVCHTERRLTNPEPGGLTVPGANPTMGPIRGPKGPAGQGEGDERRAAFRLVYSDAGRHDGAGRSVEERGAEPGVVCGIAKAAERAGFEYALVPVQTMCYEAWITCAMISAQTERMKMLVAIRAGFIAPTVMAKMFTTFDQLSKGRIYANLIAGGGAAELAADGCYYAHDDRYAVMDETVTLMKRCWTEPKKFDHEGRFFKAEGVRVFPRPYQQPHPPFYLGGMSEAAKEISAKHAHVHLFWGDTPERIAGEIADLRNGPRRTDARES